MTAASATKVDNAIFEDRHEQRPSGDTSKAQNGSSRPPLMKVPLSDIYVDAGAIDAVSRVLASKRFILGDETSKFEREFADKIGTKHAIAVSSGTAAIYLSLLSRKLGKGDEVLVPSFSFIASASPIVDVGAKPIFVDVDRDTLTIDPYDLKEKITERTKAILPVHLFGHPAYMDEITEIAEKHSLEIIEDCAQAHGAMMGSRNVGTFGIAACFSFYPSKNMTVYGDGGMVTTDDQETADKVRMLRNHGRVEKYVHQMLGYNFRLGEIAAALGRYQLAKLDKFNESRRKAARHYDEKLGETVVTPMERLGFSHVYHMYVIRTPQRDGLKQFLSSRGIETSIHYPVPIHLQPPFKNHVPKGLHVTEEHCEYVLSLPMFPSITADQLEYVTTQIRRYFESPASEIVARASASAVQ